MVAARRRTAVEGEQNGVAELPEVVQAWKLVELQVESRGHAAEAIVFVEQPVDSTDTTAAATEGRRACVEAGRMAHANGSTGKAERIGARIVVELAGCSSAYWGTGDVVVILAVVAVHPLVLFAALSWMIAHRGRKLQVHQEDHREQNRVVSRTGRREGHLEMFAVARLS